MDVDHTPANSAAPTAASTAAVEADTARNARARKLRVAFELALRAAVSKLSQKNLEASFPRLAKSIPEQLEAVREQTVEFIQAAAQEEFDIIMEKRNVVARLAELDHVIENGRRADGSAAAAASGGTLESHA
ncbi:hypothetical protein HK405_014366, partial [Cladochytrium tenue]